jgi:transposase
MAIVAGFDVHRAQITFDALDTEAGEVHRGRIPADPESVRGWVGRFGGERVEVAVEACTGWLFVCEALREAGAVAHLAETDETHARRGKRRRAKTDRQDARWLRVLLAEGRLPEAWIRRPNGASGAPAPGCAGRSSTSARPGWCESKRRCFTTASRARRTSRCAAAAASSWPGSSRPTPPASGPGVALQMIDALDRRLAPLGRDIRALARRRAGCREPMRHYGIGPVTATSIVAELGDVSRLPGSRTAVRCAGPGVGVHRPDHGWGG